MNGDTDSADVHRHYVNAERQDEGIPNYFDAQLKDDLSNDLLQRAVFRELWYRDETIYSIGQLESDFDNGRETIRSRLDEMVEQGVLKKSTINNGDYWWINFPESNNPLPKDAVTYSQPENEEMSVSEFFSQYHIQIGAVALLATIVGGAIVWFGALQSSGISLLPVPASEVISLGLITLFSSYLFLLMAIVVWIIQKAFVTDGEGASGIFSAI